MRYPSFRSFLRTAIAVGVVVSYQSSLFAWSWKEILHPHAGVCILHDLHWDPNSGAPQSRPETETDANSDLLNDRAEISVQDFDFCGMESIENDSYARHIESEQCIEAAKEFEFRSQMIAAWAEIESGSSQLVAQSRRLFSAFGQSSTSLITLIRSNSLQLMEWISIPETLPVTVLQTEQMADANNSYESEWNCTAWEPIVVVEETDNFPVRDHANIYAFVFQSSDADACTNVATMPVQTEQLGDDPTDRDFDKNPLNTWQVGVDPVCPEIHHSNNAFRWSDLCEQPMICCPFDGRSYGDAIADSKIVCMEDAIRPPTLESDFDSSVDPVGIGHCFVQADDRVPPDSRTNIGMFSREDLQFASKVYSKVVSDMCFDTDDVPSQKSSGTENESPQIIQNYAPKDFISHRHDSAFGTLFLPWASSQQIAIDFAMKHFVGTSENVQFQASKSIAKQIRLTGQFLLEFASKIETVTERVELARRDGNRR